MQLYRYRLIAQLVAAVFLLLVLVGSTAAGTRLSLDQPPNPELLVPGIFVGAVPPGAEWNPVLVFVHGYGATAGCWWGSTPFDGVNDMYVTAYNTGYRTAFVSLDGPEGQPADSMWANGLVLSLQLRVIAGHYDVDQVEIVAHSKGGVDAQTAIVYFGGWERVGHLFTLGSPHQGSELADAAYSWWGSWLAELLGLHDAGTYTLQTGYMSFFRELTDPKAQGQPVSYYTAAGTDTGPEGSALHLLGRYLSRFGPSDGVVTVASTELAGASTLFVEPFHHMNIYMGSTAFPWIDSVLGGTDRVQSRPTNLSLRRRVRISTSQANGILRGGRLNGPTIEVLPVESNTRAATFHLLGSEKAVTATLVGPDGVAHPLELIGEETEGLFDGAWHWSYTGSGARGGQWRVHIEGPPGSAYFLIVSTESPLRVALRGLPEGTITPGKPLRLSASASVPFGQAAVHEIEAHITRSLPGRSITKVETLSSSGSSLTWTPTEEGIYVVSVTVRGRSAGGKLFERSFVRSLAVARRETLSGPPTMLDK